MKSHFNSFIICLLTAMFGIVNANAYDFEADGIYYNITSADIEATLTVKDYINGDANEDGRATRHSIAAGRNEIALANGIYIIRINNQTFKLII